MEMNHQSKQRLQVLLQDCQHIGSTTSIQRRSLSKNSLIQRLLEIQAQQLIIDDEYEQCLQQSNHRQRLIELDDENDVLADEADEIETLLYEEHEVAGGGRCLLTDEAIEAAGLGERLARSSRLELSGNTPVSAPASLTSFNGHNHDIVQKQSVIPDSGTSEISQNVTNIEQSDSQSNNLATSPTHASNSQTTQSMSLSNDQTSQPFDPSSEQSSSQSNKSKRGCKRKITRVSQSQSAVLARLNDAADRIAERRAAAQAQDSLLGKLFQFFDNHIDFEPARSTPVRRQKERSATVLSFPYILGTIQFNPFFTCPDEMIEKISSNNPIAVNLDFGCAPCDDHRQCLVTSLLRPDTNMSNEAPLVFGYLPFPSDVCTDTVVAAVSEVPHPLAAIEMLLQNQLIKVECALVARRSSNVDVIDQSDSSDIDVVDQQRLVEVMVFVHSKFIGSTLRSVQLRYAMLSLLDLFPPIANIDNQTNSQSIDQSISQSSCHENHPCVHQEALPLSHDELIASSRQDIPNIFDQITSSRRDVLASKKLDVLSKFSSDSIDADQLQTTNSSSFDNEVSSPNSSGSLVVDCDQHAVIHPVQQSNSTSHIANDPAAPAASTRRVVPQLVCQHSSSIENSQSDIKSAVLLQNENAEDETRNLVDGSIDMFDESENGYSSDESIDADSYIESKMDSDDDVYDLGLKTLDATPRRYTFVPLHVMPAAAAAMSDEKTDVLHEEEDEEEDEGLRIEEQYELSNLALSQDNENASGFTKANQSIIHSMMMSRHDLYSLYELLRPSPRWTADQPAGMVTPLLLFQKQALAWMIDRESDRTDTSVDDPSFVSVELHGTKLWFNRLHGYISTTEPEKCRGVLGGILADSMGLGKTLSCIGLILSKPYDSPMSSCSVNSKDTIPRSLSNKPCLKATLIVSPISLVHQWQSEILKHAPSLRVLVYHSDMEVDIFPSTSSSSRAQSAAQATQAESDDDADYKPSRKKKKIQRIHAQYALIEYDVVLTSYSVLAAEVNYSSEMSYNLRHAKVYQVPNSPLLDCHWHRVVLDEAQRVQNSVSTSGRMAKRIESTNRWCVTGTPIGRQGLADLYGLISFLGLEPYASQESAWNRLMDIGTFEGTDRLVELLRRVMWRHSKAHVRDQIGMPSLTMHTHHLSFMPVEWEAYRKYEYDLKGLVRQAYDGQTISSKSAVAKSLSNQIDALRQMCDHPQIAAQSFLSTTGQLQTMSEISARLLARAHDELGEAERELCRSLNSLGTMYQSIGRFDEAEKHFTYAWRVYDLGLARASQAITQSDEEVRAQKVEIVTQNSAQRAWKFIELISISRLKQVYESKRNQLSEDSLDCSDLDNKIDSFGRQLDNILDDILDALLDNERKNIVLCDHINAELLPMWIVDASSEIQALAAERLAGVGRGLSLQDCVAEFHEPASFARVTQLKKQWKPLETCARDVCRRFEDEISRDLLHDLIDLRISNPQTCHAKRMVHQQLLNAYYPVDHESRLDALLQKAYNEVKRNIIHRTKQFVDQMWEPLSRQGESISLSNVDWKNASMRLQFENDWAIARASVASLECMIDYRKASLKQMSCRSGINSSKTAILQQCHSKSIRFMADPKSFCENLVEQATKKSSKFAADDSTDVRDDESFDTEIHDRHDQINVDRSVLESEAAIIENLKIVGIRKHHQLIYLQRKLEGLSTASSSLNIEDSCSICHAKVRVPVITSCGHLYCFDCLQNWMLRNHRSQPLGAVSRSRRVWQTGKCPNCFRVLTADEIVEMPHNRVNLDNDDDDDVLDDGDDTKPVSSNRNDSHSEDHTVTRVLHSSEVSSSQVDPVVFPSLPELAKITFPGQNMYGTKIDSISRHLLYLVKNHPRVKSLVFSQFQKMLTLFAKVLDALSISYVLLQGDGSQSAALIERFQTDANCSVMLMSLRRDSSGLTLVSASQIFLVEPSVDSSVEAQAINRIHRIGQKVPCQVHKFIMRNSIEANIEAKHDDHAGLISANEPSSLTVNQEVEISDRELLQRCRENGLERDQLFDILDLEL